MSPFMLLLPFLLVLSHAHSTTIPATYKWSDWDKRQTCTANAYLQPKSVDEVVSIVKSANSQVKVVGAGHSFSSCTLTDSSRPSILLNLDNLSSLLSPPTLSNSGEYIVRIQAGMRVHNLNDKLLALGFALENAGAIAQQSVAGATQTGTHGTGKELGSMSSQIMDITFVLANGTIVHGNASHNVDLYNAGRVGLGALGVVVEVGLRVVPKFKLRRELIGYDLGDLMEQLPHLYEKYERMQWYYTPFTKNASLLLRIPVPISTPISPCWPGDLKDISGTAGSDGGNISCTDWSFKALCHEADDATLYTEMEYFVDKKDGEALARDFQDFQESIIDKVNCSDASVCSLFTGLRYAKKDDMWLSPMYNRDIAVVSMIVLGTPNVSGPKDVVQIFDRGLTQLAKKYNGRPHWGKLHFATEKDLRPLYPRFDDFKKLRNELDPNGMFLNQYLRTVLGIQE